MTGIITYYVEMNHPDELRPARESALVLELRQVEIPSPAYNRFLYATVGQAWAWIDRLAWSEEEWLHYLNRADLQTWVAYVQGTPAGYFELERQADANVEIVYFGLMPQFIGQGIGGQLLTLAVERAWQMSATRVWLHTCSKDHPHALANYEARGFKLYRREES